MCIQFRKAISTLILMYALSHAILLEAQVSFYPDTLKIEEVIITRKQINSEQPGFRFFTIDSGKLDRFSHFALNDVLRESTTLYIKEYGAGLIATSSFRGTSAGHTQVTWNGININDPMLGQTDFSLIPAGMTDNILVSFGGASMDLGSGAIGGIINLDNKPSWKRKTVITAAPATGSFGRYSGLVKVSTGSDKFQSVTRTFLNSVKNDFSYFNNEASPEPVRTVRENNNLLQQGFMQEFYLRMSGDVLSARFWYQSASRDLPGSILYGYMEEKQRDRSFRTLISYDAVRSEKDFFVSLAHMMTDMFYSSMFDTTGSANRVNTIIVRGGLTRSLGSSTSLKIVLNDQMDVAESDYYLGKTKHNLASLTLSAERKKGKWFGAALLLRETLSDGTLLIPDFSAGIEMRTIRDMEHYLKFNVARNSKIPSLNDRFWNPGGNPDLENEYAYSFEAGYSLHQNIGKPVSISSELNFFNNYIRNMIQWYPDTSFIWTAGNIGQVNTSGLEYSLGLKYQSGRFICDFSGAWSYTGAKDLSSVNAGNQLIYVPRHQANGILRLVYSNLYSEWMTGFTGPIFTTADNSEVLDEFLINSLTTGYMINSGNISADLRVRIHNIFNRSYQTVAYYPQPGRSFLLSLSLRFKV